MVIVLGIGGIGAGASSAGCGGGHAIASGSIKTSASAMGTVFAILFFIGLPPLRILFIFIGLPPLRILFSLDSLVCVSLVICIFISPFLLDLGPLRKWYAQWAHSSMCTTDLRYRISITSFCFAREWRGHLLHEKSLMLLDPQATVSYATCLQ
jgi:hypothetical protein